MHEKRNFIMVILAFGVFCWGFYAWFVMKPDAPLRLEQGIASTVIFVGLCGGLFFALKIEDKLPDHLKEIVGEYYYEADGLSFMPIVRVKDDQAELCVYYQNRYENPVHAVIHFRPAENSFMIMPGARDVHIAFTCGGGAFGVIHQPIAVPIHAQGDVVEVALAAAAHYPRSHGACLRKHAGRPCGTMHVDWSGAAFRSGVHEVSGEIVLLNPTTLRLSMPMEVKGETTERATWRQEQLAAGAPA